MKRTLRRLLKFTAIGLCLFALFIYGVEGGRSLFEHEVSNSYLTKLFQDDRSVGKVRLVEDLSGRRFLVIRNWWRMSTKDVATYIDRLQGRGINVFGEFHYGWFSWQKTLNDYAITITRPVKGDVDTIDVSESVVKDPKSQMPLMAMSVRWNVMRIQVAPDFGMRWKKIQIIPVQEPNEPDPIVGRYPGAKLREMIKLPSGNKLYHYVAKDSLKNVAEYYHNKVSSIYSKVDSSWPTAEQRVINNPFYRVGVDTFGVKSMGKFVYVGGWDPKRIIKPHMLDVKIRQSLDKNIKQYVQIEVMEN